MTEHSTVIIYPTNLIKYYYSQSRLWMDKNKYAVNIIIPVQKFYPEQKNISKKFDLRNKAEIKDFVIQQNIANNMPIKNIIYSPINEYGDELNYVYIDVLSKGEIYKCKMSREDLPLVENKIIFINHKHKPYCCYMLDSKIKQLHNLIMDHDPLNDPDKLTVDHIDGDTLNNTCNNLRLADGLSQRINSGFDRGEGLPKYIYQRNNSYLFSMGDPITGATVSKRFSFCDRKGVQIRAPAEALHQTIQYRNDYIKGHPFLYELIGHRIDPEYNPINLAKETIIYPTNLIKYCYYSNNRYKNNVTIIIPVKRFYPDKQNINKKFNIKDEAGIKEFIIQQNIINNLPIRNIIHSSTDKNGKELDYVFVDIFSKGDIYKCKMSREDLPLIEDKLIYIYSDRYKYCGYTDNEKTVKLDNLIMNIHNSSDDAKKLWVDHLNDDQLDNTRNNLKLVKNINKKNRSDYLDMPKNIQKRLYGYWFYMKNPITDENVSKTFNFAKNGVPFRTADEALQEAIEYRNNYIKSDPELYERIGHRYEMAV